MVRVHLAGISTADLRRAEGRGSFRGVLGHEMVGTVVSGPPSWREKRVVCEPDGVCGRCDLCLSGLSAHCRHRQTLGTRGRDGCMADALVVPERSLVEVPQAVTNEEAVFAVPLASACHVLAQHPADPKGIVSVIGCGRLGLLTAQVLKDRGCRLNVIGRNNAKLALCDRKGIQATAWGEAVAKEDRHLVVECTGSAAGLELALRLLRPRGTLILKGTYCESERADLTPVVEKELHVMGSGRSPLLEALQVLARQAVDVRSLIARIYPIEQVLDAFCTARRPENVKVLLRIHSDG